MPIRVYTWTQKISGQIRVIRGEKKKISADSCLFVDLKVSVQIREIRGEQKKISADSRLSVDTG